MFAQNLPESIIKTFSIRIKELGGVNLGQGIPSFPTAPHICEAAKIALAEKDIGVYPNFLGTMELRTAITDKLNATYGLSLAPQKHVLVTVGAMEGFASSVLSLLTAGDTAGIISPDYCNHFPAIMLARGAIHEIALRENDDWHIDTEKVAAAAEKGMKLLVLTNPSNPTGAVFDKAEITALVELANQYGFWIISDETYAFLDYDGGFTSLCDVWKKSDRLIVVRSFSKEYAMTGWRVGYVVAPESTIKQIAKTHDALVGCVPKISQIAAVAALTGDQTIVAHYKDVLEKRRDIVCRHLDTMTDWLTYQKPHGAYYVFPRYKKQEPSMELAKRILEEARVAVVPGSVFGSSGEGHIRISFAVDDKQLAQGMKQLQQFFASSSS